jgi:hypothetical protein
MYELYLNGYTCEQIFKANGGAFEYGAIIDAKDRLNWDIRRDRQLMALHSQVERKVYKVKQDALSHLSDLLAAAHKIWGDKVAQFLQEGNQELLQGFDPSSLKNYKEILTMLKLLTEGTGDKKEVMVGGTVKHLHAVTSEMKGPEAKRVSSAAASELLDLIATREQNAK